MEYITHNSLRNAVSEGAFSLALSSDELLITKPVYRHDLDKWATTVTHRVIDNNGLLLGLIKVKIDLARLSHSWENKYKQESIHSYLDKTYYTVFDSTQSDDNYEKAVTPEHVRAALLKKGLTLDDIRQSNHIQRFKKTDA